MAKIKREWMDMIEGVMAEYGVARWNWTECKRHPAVEFKSKLDGSVRKLSFPGSTSDHRSFLNTRAELRRAVRAAGYEKETT